LFYEPRRREGREGREEKRREEKNFTIDGRIAREIGFYL